LGNQVSKSALWQGILARKKPIIGIESHCGSRYIELKLALSDALAKRRKKSNLTQAQLAKLLKSSQSRIAKAIA